jgi:hypothetical protein
MCKENIHETEHQRSNSSMPLYSVLKLINQTVFDKVSQELTANEKSILEFVEKCINQSEDGKKTT